MQRLNRVVIIALLVVMRSSALAQQAQGQGQGQQVARGSVPSVFETRLFPLEYLSNADALKLVAPFGPSYDAGPAIRAVTVKATKDVLARVDSLLKAFDRPPTTVVLRFQLIAAVDSGARDASIPSDVDASLRDLFKFGSYRLLAEGTTVNSGTDFRLTMSSQHSDRTTITEVYTVSGEVSPVGSGTAARSIQMRVFFSQQSAARRAGITASGDDERLLSTGLTIPFGQTVVLGSAAASQGAGRRALILTVRPEIQKSAGR